MKAMERESGGEGRATAGRSVSAYMNRKRPQSCNIKTNSADGGRGRLQVGGNESTLQKEERHGRPTERLSELRLIGTDQRRQPSGSADHQASELIYRSL